MEIDMKNMYDIDLVNIGENSIDFVCFNICFLHCMSKSSRIGISLIILKEQSLISLPVLLIYHYGLIFDKKYHPKNITVGGLLIKDGHKISKSKGNGIPLSRIKDIYGADLYRLYIATAASFDVEMDFRDDEIYNLEKRFNRFKELMFKAKEQSKTLA